MDGFAARYGPTALIAGGSEGVGASYARQLAEKGIDLILVARHAYRLEKTRAALARDFPERSVRAICADLTAPTTPARLASETADAEIGLLVYNAGSNWKNADFLDNPLSYANGMVALNVTAPMALCHHFGRLMRERRRGGLIVVSSLAYLAGGAKIAVYSAAKAFSTTLLEALWLELEPFGVDVLSHALGSVDTPFIERHYPAAYGHGDQPDDVARDGLAALGRGPLLRAGQGDAFHAALSAMPRSDAVRAMAAAGKKWDQD